MNHRKSFLNVAVFVLALACAGVIWAQQTAQQTDLNWPPTNAPAHPPAGTISLEAKPKATNAPAPAAPMASQPAPAQPEPAAAMAEPAAEPTMVASNPAPAVETPSNAVPPAARMFNPAATNLPSVSGSNTSAAEFLATNPPVLNLMTTNEVTLTNAVTVTNSMMVTNLMTVTNRLTVTNAVMLTNAITLTNRVVVTNTVTVTNTPITNFPVTVSLDLKHPGQAVPENFIGLSFEAAQCLLDTNTGVRYFRPNNLPLIHLFQTLGVKSLRIGGNTSDRDVRQLPSTADLDSLFEFAKAANVKVIYCLRLCSSDSKQEAQNVKYDVDTAKYIWDRYAKSIDCFSIGQEPSAYPVQKRDTRAQDERMGATNEKYKYADYQVLWKKFATALIAAIPDIRLCGPSVHNNGEWARNFIRDFGQDNNVVLVTEHLYPGGAGGKIPSPEIGIDRMLASDMSVSTNAFPKVYEKLYENFAPMAATNHLPYRLEEVNNYFNGGATNVSNTFAAAIWGLDFMYWWASHDAAGLNFHTGDRVAAGNSLQPSKYTAYHTSTNGYQVRPLGYGIKAFQLGAHGKFAPTTISNVYNVNVTAYANGEDGKDVRITVINKEHGDNARDADVTVDLGSSAYRYSEAIFLVAPTNFQEYATSDIKLGDGPISNDGTWKGSWTMINRPTNGLVHLKVRACSAVVIYCSPANYDETRIGSFVLPDPLVAKNGSKLHDSESWTRDHRGDLLKLYEDQVYGTSPKWRNILDKVLDADKHALGDKAIRKQVELEFYNYKATNHVALHILLYTPAAATNRVPVFLCLSFSPNYADVNDTNIAIYPVWNRKTNTTSLPKDPQFGSSHNWPVEKIIDRGYGIAFLDYNEIEPDLADGTGWKYGVRALYMKPGETNLLANDWGAISAWAWGASRVLDYLESDRDVDASHVFIVGQSRLGKTALWAGAEDTRFAGVIASCSGEMGAALARRDYGETVNSMSKDFAYQFCQNFLDYSNKVSNLPVDSHTLLSLIAPRPLFLNTGSEDRWSDPRGEFEAAIAATPVYKLFGKQSVVTNLPPDVMTNGSSGSLLKSDTLESYSMPTNDIPIMRDIGFQVHTGKHDILPPDWDRFLDFADMHFYGKQPPEYPNTNSELKSP